VIPEGNPCSFPRGCSDFDAPLPPRGLPRTRPLSPRQAAPSRRPETCHSRSRESQVRKVAFGPILRAEPRICAASVPRSKVSRAPLCVRASSVQHGFGARGDRSSIDAEVPSHVERAETYPGKVICFCISRLKQRSQSCCLFLSNEWRSIPMLMGPRKIRRKQNMGN